MNSKTQKHAPATLIQNIRHIGKRTLTLLAYWKFFNALWPILPTFDMLPGIDFRPGTARDRPSLSGRAPVAYAYQAPSTGLRYYNRNECLKGPFMGMGGYLAIICLSCLNLPPNSISESFPLDGDDSNGNCPSTHRQKGPGYLLARSCEFI
jgi:hypothetical protein